jgi:hypothetical protein
MAPIDHQYSVFRIESASVYSHPQFRDDLADQPQKPDWVEILCSKPLYRLPPKWFYQAANHH